MAFFKISAVFYVAFMGHSSEASGGIFSITGASYVVVFLRFVNLGGCLVSERSFLII